MMIELMSDVESNLLVVNYFLFINLYLSLKIKVITCLYQDSFKKNIVLSPSY